MVLYGNAPGSAVEAATVTMASLAAIFVGLRLYARLVVAKNAGWDDGFIFGALMFSVATTITMIAQVETGMGKHEWEIQPHDAVLNLRAFWAMIIVYNISLTCTKVSILIQYLRIFPQKPMRVATWTVMGVVLFYALWRFFSAVFTCYPVQAFWDHTIQDKKCQDREALSLASTSLNMSTDIAIAILPLPFLNKLQLPRRQKYALMVVFSLAGLVVIISILRLPSLYTLMSSKDTSYQNPMACIWSTIEMNVGIICSCLPTLRCLFPRLFENLTAGSVGRQYDFSRSAGTHSHSSSSSRKVPLNSSYSVGEHDSQKSIGYATVGATSTGGSGSFAGKFNTSIVSTTPLSPDGQVQKKHHRWGSRDGSFVGAALGRGRGGATLTPVEEIEMGSRKSDSLRLVEQGQYAELAGDDVNRIYVQTEINQVESVKGRAEGESPAARGPERRERGMV